MKSYNNLYLNFSSIPNLTKKARNSKKKFNKNNFSKLINFAYQRKFIGVEFPYFRFFKDDKYAEYFFHLLKGKKMNYIIDCEKKINKKEILKLIKIAKYFNLNFIRVKASSILSCERYKYRKNWKEKINAIIKILNNLKPVLKKNNIKLALENHQDLDSHDLNFIIKKIGSNYVGINFDVGNSYATCEKPIDFLKKNKNFIINVHLKDYIILETKNGFSLNRCPIMDGNSEIDKVVKFIKKSKLNIPLSIELGSPKSREIKIKSKKFFNFFIKEKQSKYKYANNILKIAKKNSQNINELNNLISLNELNMLCKSIENIKHI